MRKGWFVMVPTAIACCGCLAQNPTQEGGRAPEKSPSAATTSGNLDEAASRGGSGLAPSTRAVAGASGLALPDEPRQPPTQPPFVSSAPQQSEAPPKAKPAAKSPAGGAVPAKVGVGAKGRSLDNESGVLVTPARSLFAFQERAVFQIEIPKAMQLFEATESRKPKTHEEFMSRVVEANNIRLPRLPDGQRYRYDPQSGDLMVVRENR